MSIIDPRKGNETQRPNIKIFFPILLLSLANSHLNSFSPSSLASNIHHIQLLRLFNQKSPFSLFSLNLVWSEQKKSARKAIVLTPFDLSEKKMPNHHLGCGYVDVWSRVMLLQFPSGRLFSFFIIFLFLRPILSLVKRKIVYILDIFSMFFLRVFRHSVPLRSSSPSQKVFFSHCCPGPEYRVKKK